MLLNELWRNVRTFNIHLVQAKNRNNLKISSTTFSDKRFMIVFIGF